MYDKSIMLEFYNNIQAKYAMRPIGRKYPTPSQLSKYAINNSNIVMPEHVIVFTAAYLLDTYHFEFKNNITITQVINIIEKEFCIVSKKSKKNAKQYEFPLFFQLTYYPESFEINESLCDDFIDFYICYHTVITN